MGGLAAARRRADVRRGIAFGRVGQQLHDDFEQLGDAGGGFRGREHHWYEVPLAQRAFQWLVQLLGRHFALLQIGLHQLLVDLHDLVDELAVGFGDGGEIRLARRRKETV